jgi:Mg-chelatase subunit ChlI
MEIVERHIAYENDPERFRAEWMPYEQSLGEQIAAARDMLDQVQYTRLNLRQIAELTSAAKIDGHRADMVILKTARAHAALNQRDHLTAHDILIAATLAIPHRLKRGPFTDAQMSQVEMEKILEKTESTWGEGDEAEPTAPDSGEEQAVKKKVPQQPR